MKLSRLLFIAFAAVGFTTRADSPWANAEHVYYIRIETDPAGATLTSIPAKEGDEPVVLGKTPVVIPIEMNWDRSYLRKSWAKLRVATRGNIATNEFDKDTKDQTVWLKFAIEKDGYTRQVARQVAGVFQYDEQAEDWDHAINELAERRTLDFTLVAAPDKNAPQTNASQSPAPATNSTPPTVIVASGNKTDASTLGYALVDSPVGSTILVDGISVGIAPVRVMLGAGEHIVRTLQNGKPARPQTVTITAGKTETVSIPLEK